MANLLEMSSIAYGDIERNKTDVTHSRLEQIAKVLGKDILGLLAHGEQIANIFSNCSNNHVIGIMGSGDVIISEKELRHELEKARLEIAKLTAEKEKAEMEAQYWREKCNPK